MSDIINGLGSSSYLNTYNTTTSSSKTAESLEGKLSSTDLSKASDEELMSVCKDFESYFVEQMYKTMEKMVPKSEDGDSSSSQLKDYFQDELTSKYSTMATESNGGKGFGIAQSLYEQMKRNYSSTELK